MALTYQQGKSFLGSLSDLLAQIVLDGIAVYNSGDYGSRVRTEHTSRTISDIFNSHIVFLAEARLRDSLGSRLRVETLHGRVLFIIDGKVCISFKKFSNNLMTYNIPTKQALKFRGQDTLFPGFPELTNLFVGYKSIDAAQTEFEVWAACPGPQLNRWAHKLSGPGRQLELPIPPAPPIKPQFGQRVWVRDKEARNDKAHQSSNE